MSPQMGVLHDGGNGGGDDGHSTVGGAGGQFGHSTVGGAGGHVTGDAGGHVTGGGGTGAQIG